jgi:hypothetical protein
VAVSQVLALPPLRLKLTGAVLSHLLLPAPGLRSCRSRRPLNHVAAAPIVYHSAVSHSAYMRVQPTWNVNDERNTRATNLCATMFFGVTFAAPPPSGNIVGAATQD